MESGAERREHPRRHYHGPVQFIVPHHAPLLGRIADVSVGGMGVVAAINPPPRMLCEVRFLLPMPPHGNAALDLQARVVHSVLSRCEGGFLIGLQFVKLTPEQKTLIERFIHA